MLRSGVTPGQPEFNEAQSALEKAVAEHPNDASAQIALGQAYLLAGRLDDAIAHLDAARQMKPDQASIYASLAKAYQRKGDSQRAEEALQRLETLNQAQARTNPIRTGRTENELRRKLPASAVSLLARRLRWNSWEGSVYDPRSFFDRNDLIRLYAPQLCGDSAGPQNLNRVHGSVLSQSEMQSGILG